MARSPKLSQRWEPHQWTRVSNPNKPVTIYFDVYAIIAKNTAIRGYCGDLAWERAYMLKDKHMCPKSNPYINYCESYEGRYYPY
jgi:hypothetical protein